jgi:hypothetical protein
MSNTDSENIQLMGAALIVLSLALLYCWYQSNEQNGCNKQYINGPRMNYKYIADEFKSNKSYPNPLYDMTTDRIIRPFTSNQYKSKANFTNTRRIVDGGITPNAEAATSPIPSPVALASTHAPISSSSSVSANILARKTSALKKKLSDSYSPFDDSTIIRNFNVSDVETTQLNDMVNNMNAKQISALECPLSTTSMVMSMSDFTPQCST